jgi:hypothetical protein
MMSNGLSSRAMKIQNVTRQDEIRAFMALVQDNKSISSSALVAMAVFPDSTMHAKKDNL